MQRVAALRRAASMASAPEDSWSAWVVREVREHQLRSVGAACLPRACRLLA